MFEAYFSELMEQLFAPLFVGCLVACFAHWLNNRK